MGEIFRTRGSKRGPRRDRCVSEAGNFPDGLDVGVGIESPVVVAAKVVGTGTTAGLSTTRTPPALLRLSTVLVLDPDY